MAILGQNIQSGNHNIDFKKLEGFLQATCPFFPIYVFDARLKRFLMYGLKKQIPW